MTSVLLLLALGQPASPTPQAVLDRAIAAHGGRDKLAAVRADKVKLKGTILVGSAMLPFTNEMTLQLPGQFKSVVRLDTGSATRTVVHLLDGDRASLLVDNQPQPAAQLAQLQQTLQLEKAMRLVPLLTDPGYTLTSLPDVRYNKLVYHGVRVQKPGAADLKLYFDQATGLLVKTEVRLPGTAGAEVVQEAYYGDYRDHGGYVRPGKIIVYRDGKKVMDAELVEARRFDRLDPTEFSRP